MHVQKMVIGRHMENGYCNITARSTLVYSIHCTLIFLQEGFAPPEEDGNVEEEEEY